MNNDVKWGIGLDDNYGSFLLGFNTNFGNGSYYICIYLGFKTLVIGKSYFNNNENEEGYE